MNFADFTIAFTKTIIIIFQPSINHNRIRNAYYVFTFNILLHLQSPQHYFLHQEFFKE